MAHPNTPIANSVISHDSDYTSEYKVVFTQWKQRAFIEFYLQMKSVYYYRWVHNLISYPIILLSTISGTSIFSTNNTTIQYIAAAFSVSSALLTGVLRQLKPGELATSHLAATRRWSKVLQQLQQLEMFSTIKSSSSASHLEIMNQFNKIQSEIDSIISSQPEPARNALTSIQKQYGAELFEKIVFGEDIQELLTEAEKAEAEWKLKQAEKSKRWFVRPPSQPSEQNESVVVERA